MEILKKILLFLKNFFIGALYPALAIGFMLLIAALMFYFQPQDFFGDKAVFPRNPHRPEVAQAWKLLKIGAGLIAASIFLLWSISKLELLYSAWSKRRQERKAENQVSGQSNP